MNVWSILQKNRSLRMAHAGKRCFIIGNGPSIKQQDLRSLRDEITVAVNSFYLHPDLKEIQPKYWVIADPAYWETPDNTLLPILNGITSQDMTVRLVMPSGALPLMTRLNYGPAIEPFFFHYDWGLPEPVQDIDLTTAVPPYGQTVVIPALMLAYFMGCNPIYLLGCDHDWFGWTAETYEQAQFPHFYAPEANKGEAPSHQERFSFAELTAAVGTMRYQYTRLKEYGDARGFDVFNATAGGHLDIFPRVDFASLLPPGNRPLPTDAVLDALRPEARHLAQVAVQLLNAGEAGAALVMMDRALAENTHTLAPLDGLDFLKACCLTELGLFPEALAAARQEIARGAGHPAPRQLAKALERSLASGHPPESPCPVDPAVVTRRPDPDEAAMRAQRLLAEGEALFGQGELAVTLTKFRTALALDPESAQAHNDLGVTFWQLGLLPQALLHLRRALQIQPSDRETLLNLAEVLEGLGMTEELTLLARQAEAGSDPEVRATLERLVAGAHERPAR